jgi:chromosome partitioning protein
MPRSLTVSAWRVHVGMSTCKHAHMKIVAVVNQKGGVGKTATVLGLASAAAQEPSRRTLIVDLDPQANATVGLGVEGGEFTTGDVLFADAKGVAADAITKTAWGDGVSCIPANLALAERDADVSLGSEFRLRKALAGVEGFDLVLIDCPPSIGRLVTNGLVAADHALVVTQAAAPSLMGVANVMATVDVVSEHYNPGLAVAGIVVNLLPPRQREADYRLAELVEAFGTTVWEPYVPARAVVSEAQGASAPIHDFASRGRDVAAVYEALVARVMALGTG